ncbi:hypothetical protein ACHQM5_019371 [Ranunculus cassubicifolius]
MSDSTLLTPLNPTNSIVDSKYSSIVDSKYCVPYDVRFHIGRKRLAFEEYSFIVTDESGMINWQIIMYNPLRYNSKFLVHDNEGKIIMTVCPGNVEFFSKSTYKVYKGDSTDEKDFLFSMKRPWGLFWKCDLEGYLPSTKEEKGGFDFEAVGFWLNSDFVVKQKGGYVLADGCFGYNRWSQNFNVIVSSNVDYAFMVAVALMYFDSSTGSPESWLENPEDIPSDDD